MIAPPTPSPIISPLRRRAADSASSVGAPRKRDGGGTSGSSIGEITSVRSAIAVACCSRFSRVGALRMPPPSCTARAAAAEIWNGMSRSTARGSMGWPAASSSAGANPLRTPDSGSGHRLISSA